MGSLTCQVIRNEVSESDILLVWGTIGACEFSNFQTGQRALVEGAIKTIGADTAVAQPQHTLVVGDASVEWFARFSDSDGEIEGELVKYGRLAFTSRESSLFCGLITGQYSRSLLNLQRREPILESEMIYNTVVAVEEEEEEEEEEDEDD